MDRRLSTYSIVNCRSTVFRLLIHSNKPLDKITKDDIHPPSRTPSLKAIT
ncbi:MAG: hypothetical protein WHS82_01745 [Candidatus Methanosuratincola sp.]